MRTQQVFGGPTDLPGSAGAPLSWTSRATTSRILTQCLTWHKMSSASERVCQALPARARMRIGRFTVDGWRTSPGMDPCMDPPEVEDQLGQAIREDTPGYIPKVLPKLIPYGTGDYHCDKPGLHPTFRFEEWGRYVMLWHDGRFLRHTRFRYWLLDTMLRLLVPVVQRTFFRMRKACEDYTLGSLTDRAKRRELVQIHWREAEDAPEARGDGPPDRIGDGRPWHERWRRLDPVWTLYSYVHRLQASPAALDALEGIPVL